MMREFTWDDLAYISSGMDDKNCPRSSASLVIYRYMDGKPVLDLQRFLKKSEINMYLRGGCAVICADFSLSDKADFILCRSTYSSFLNEVYETKGEVFKEKILMLIIAPLLLEGELIMLFQNPAFIDDYKYKDGYRLIFGFDHNKTKVVETKNLEYKRISLEVLAEIKRQDEQVERDLFEAMEEEKHLKNSYRQEESFKWGDISEENIESDDEEDLFGYRFSDIEEDE